MAIRTPFARSLPGRPFRMGQASQFFAGMSAIPVTHTRDLRVGDIIEIVEGSFTIDTHILKVMAISDEHVHALVVYSTRDEWSRSGESASETDKKWFTIPHGPRSEFEAQIPTTLRSLTVWRAAGEPGALGGLENEAMALGLPSGFGKITLMSVGELGFGDYLFSASEFGPRRLWYASDDRDPNSIRFTLIGSTHPAEAAGEEIWIARIDALDPSRQAVFRQGVPQAIVPGTGSAPDETWLMAAGIAAGVVALLLLAG